MLGSTRQIQKQICSVLVYEKPILQFGLISINFNAIDFSNSVMDVK